MDTHCERENPFCRESTAGRTACSAAAAATVRPPSAVRWLMMHPHAAVTCRLPVKLSTSEMSFAPPSTSTSFQLGFHSVCNAPGSHQDGVFDNSQPPGPECHNIDFPAAALSWASVSSLDTFHFTPVLLHASSTQSTDDRRESVEVFSVHILISSFCTKIHEYLLAYP